MCHGRNSSSSRIAEIDPEKENEQVAEQVENQLSPRSAHIPPRKTYLQQVRVMNKTDPESPVFMMMFHLSFGSALRTLSQALTWLMLTQLLMYPGMIIGLVALAFTSTFPVIAAAPPYSWPARSKQLHWIGLVFAIGMFQFGAFFYLPSTLAFAIDSYESNVPEMLIAMNIGKQAISFCFGYKVIDWITESGYVTIFAGIFCGVLLANNLVVFIFLAFIKPIRKWFTKTALARMHKNSIM
ncbi:hypothetical protein B0T10DRAFT_468164 [Thelonectria olida]|uniref:Uncharacterized protein n=1 Tax=Thelonectria olida TaxID=1576542 RepID=A0A9P8VLX8_9HYPO|nr:hypothetical protein B0T10DRAFT_468164 [Thelonectria olida]